MSQIKCPRCRDRIASVIAQKIYVSGMRLANQQVMALSCPHCSTIIDTVAVATGAPARVPVRGGLLDAEPGQRLSSQISS